MRLVLHPQVYSDIDKIMERYERDATRQLADEFYAELRRFMAMAARNPKRFAARERDIRVQRRIGLWKKEEISPWSNGKDRRVEL